MLLSVPVQHAADKLSGDQAKAAKARLKEVKRAWRKSSKADKLVMLRELSHLPEKSVGHFLRDTVERDDDDGVASLAAWALVRHGDPDDARDLTKAFNRAKTPGRRAACIRWLGGYGADAPLKELRKLAELDDACAEAATLAIADMNTDEAWSALAELTSGAKLPAARKAAIARLVAHGDKRGIEALAGSANLEDAAAAAHYAVGTDLETDALKQVLKFTERPFKGGRPHYFGSLLARLTKQSSHEAVAAAKMNPAFETERGWWMISFNRADAKLGAVAKWLTDGDSDKVINALRYLQRLPEPLKGDELQAAGEALAPLLDSKDDQVVAHAMFTCDVTGACPGALKKKAQAWLKDDKPFRRAAALLAAGKGGIDAADRAIELLGDDCWYVQSAALDCLLYLRPASCAQPVLDYARKHDGRMFNEAVALLTDLTGQDFGDALEKWGDWLKANPKFTPAARKLGSLRGIPCKRNSHETGATFYGMEIDSTNIQFAVDRSASMVNPVSREPDRPDFAARKKDIIERRPEAGAMMRDGFLPRFYVAAEETGAALDGLSARAKFGLTLFNNEQLEHERVTNDPKDRRDAVNWMLSTTAQGGTDIKAALLGIIDKGEADTILLLSDGEPMSLSILEMISRANAVKRVNINVVSIHQNLFSRYYLEVLAKRDHGKITDAEPAD